MHQQQLSCFLSQSLPPLLLNNGAIVVAVFTLIIRIRVLPTDGANCAISCRHRRAVVEPHTYTNLYQQQQHYTKPPHITVAAMIW